MDTLNIYGQPSWHQPAEIIGDLEALKQLQRAVESAVLRGSGVVELFASDGEGYVLTVKCVTEEQLREAPSHYTDADPSKWQLS